MSKWIVNLANYFAQYPLAALIISLEVMALAYLLRIRKLHKEDAKRLKEEEYQKQIDALYTDITNPKWIARGGKMLSYQDIEADLED